ncbi:putative ABC transporter ATP-binding protein [Caulifigura coniformis]|uniref:Putative ABC transporter ATP-binding protein n=1 Tax=Caulifigura coniformis TaxID=2527983 RepID=A0A517SJ76_9PLAN|nr:ABC transporter ATP-binding protein [Caulifigura coniformis]QDT56178.1 putative ABC transporter ATP-binding protein [Caulifigura coniformis]
MPEAVAKPESTTSWKLLRRMLVLGFQYRRECLAVVALQLVIVGLSLGGLGLTGLGIDYLRTTVDPASPAPRWPLGMAPPAEWSPQSVIWAIAGMVLASALINAFVRWAAAISAANLSQKILLNLRAGVFEKLQRLSFAFYDAGQSSSIINRAAGDVNAVRSFVDGVIIKVSITSLTLAVYIFYMLRVHVGLTLVCLSTTPLLWVGSLFFSRRVQPMYRRASELADQLVSLLVENVQGAHVIKGFGREREAIASFEAATTRIRKQKEEIFWNVSAFQPVMGGLTQLNMLILMVYGGWLVIQGQVALGSGLFVFANLLQEFANQVGQITNIANTIQSSLIGAQRVFEVLDAPLAITSSDNALPLPRARGEIEFDKVTFTYPTGRRALTDISFRVSPGECLGVTGATGSGKSTLLSLLMRFYDVDSGAVRVDGHDVRKLDLDDLRRNMGLVFQESFVFSHTIGANIAFGQPEATLEQIERSARVAAAAEFIQELPGRYDTMVGEYGSTLSGGQRQRLSIARAVLLDPPILLLDDATASVDAETEHEISTALEGASAGRTTLLISNRLSTLSRCDRVMVLDGGRVAAIGTPETLLRESAWFSGLARLQRMEEIVVAR